ncbi:PF12059 family protein [Bordetella bronchiseptica MBORD675]|uniref:DUF3540 domain-containing protein n=1 Tax=Bordetella bronchiseptica TaxID=518 RepID=UPI00028B2471|nr:DUF3540 domain-containing protein [Bordetella bronchiseptica]KDC92953.1 PF12059 family protein [Bordetella bronchiseptica MBORD675]CCJ57531.1 conserved hypothetical protein [Bordetella bronchiseptica MO149]CCN04518.1 conserved hypothetical protein [Bordetella bronchiseptica Bbr77]
MQTRNAHRLYPVYDPVHLIGTVARREDDGAWTVWCDGRPWRVRRAASCLLVPEEGDTVLISGPDAERVYLIAVVEQADAAQATLELEGRVSLRSRTADVSLEAAGEVRLRGAQAVRVETEALSVTAGQAACAAARMHYVADEVEGAVGSMRLVGKVYEAVLDRLTQLARMAVRQTSEVEHVRAGTLDYQAEQSARVHAPYTMLTADALVKVDAKQIHMG